jgi:hypothetical protein
MGIAELGAFDCDISAVVSGSGILFVTRFVLFIDDDEAEVGERGEDGGACADNDVGFARFYFVPLGISLRGGET